MDAITATYVLDNDDWAITVAGLGKELTGHAPGIIAARDRADQLVEKLTPKGQQLTVVHLLDGSALDFTTAYMTARLTRPAATSVDEPMASTDVATKKNDTAADESSKDTAQSEADTAATESGQAETAESEPTESEPAKTDPAKADLATDTGAQDVAGEQAEKRTNGSAKSGTASPVKAAKSTEKRSGKPKPATSKDVGEAATTKPAEQAKASSAS